MSSISNGPALGCASAPKPTAKLAQGTPDPTQPLPPGEYRIATGDEIVEPEDPLPPGRVRNVNEYLLTALAARNGAVVNDYGVIGDDLELLCRTIAHALDENDAVALTDTIQTILRDSNHVDVFTAACQAMCDMDLRAWLPRITSPALVLGGDEDLMTPWYQGPDGAGQQAIADGIPGAEVCVIAGANHSTIFDSTEEHNRVVMEFFARHPGAA